MKVYGNKIPSDVDYATILNYVQGSNGVNDYQLINELSSVVREYKKYRKHVDKNFIKKVYDIVFTNYKIECHGIFGNNLTDEPSCYDDELDNIFLSYNSFNWMVDFGQDSLKEEYYQAINTAVHEFTHKMQYDFIKSLENLYIDESIKNILAIYQRIYLYDDNLLVQKYLEFYEDNHDYFSLERIANNRANYIACSVMRKIYGDEKTMEYQEEIIDYLLLGYEETGEYPLKRFCNLVNKFGAEYKQFKNQIGDYRTCLPQFEPTENYLYERMCLGFPITKEELKLVNDYMSDQIPKKKFAGVIKKRKF